MLTPSLLLTIGALASLTTAQYHAAIHPGLVAKRDLAARQTDTGGDDDSGLDAATSCISDLMSIYSSLPTPPPEIFSWEEANTITDPCSITIPASLSSAFSSYESEALSWFSEHSAEIEDALSDCPLYSSLAPGDGDAPVDVCTERVGGGGGQVTTTREEGDDDDTKTTDAAGTTTRTTAGRTTGTGTTSTPTGSGTGAGQVASTQSGNVGPRETGFVAGAVALAGFLGVVAAL
ncbi:infection structure specific protein [Coniochaeta sp. 2T2.1]|nr:infection structure specific protein [Coniochaeta sp. 2T2.1]